MYTEKDPHSHNVWSSINQCYTKVIILLFDLVFYAPFFYVPSLESKIPIYCRLLINWIIIGKRVYDDKKIHNKWIFFVTSQNSVHTINKRLAKDKGRSLFDCIWVTALYLTKKKKRFIERLPTMIYNFGAHSLRWRSMYRTFSLNIRVLLLF